MKSTFCFVLWRGSGGTLELGLDYYSSLPFTDSVTIISLILFPHLNNGDNNDINLFRLTKSSISNC